ncbi:MAG: hypothetical protein CML67_00695 [Rhodobacteraceae bacterium]|nr:hypothetical protein [Paracoccaceae bacterium]
MVSRLGLVLVDALAEGPVAAVAQAEAGKLAVGFQFLRAHVVEFAHGLFDAPRQPRFLAAQVVERPFDGPEGLASTHHLSCTSKPTIS